MGRLCISEAFCFLCCPFCYAGNLFRSIGRKYSNSTSCGFPIRSLENNTTENDDDNDDNEDDSNDDNNEEDNDNISQSPPPPYATASPTSGSPSIEVIREPKLAFGQHSGSAAQQMVGYDSRVSIAGVAGIQEEAQPGGYMGLRKAPQRVPSSGDDHEHEHVVDRYSLD